MSGYISIQTKGLQELKSNLGSIAGELRAKAGDQACRAAAQLIARRARSLAPVGKSKNSPNLKKAIIVRKGDWRKYGREHVYFVTNKSGTKYKNDAFYAHMVEFGTNPHDIRATRNPQTGRLVPMPVKNMHLMKVKHPGAKARPFLTPAFEQQHEAAIQKMADRVKKLIDTGK